MKSGYKYESEYETTVIFVTLLIGGLIILVILGFASYFLGNKKNLFNQKGQVENNQWVGYCPVQVYTIYDKETGVYYAVTSEGGITPMYTIEGQVKLVDQGNEYVVHKNLGEPDAQVYD